MADFAVSDIMSAIDRLAPGFGIDPATAKSLIVAENTKDGRIRSSTFSGDATNSNGTMGIGQVIPSTARGLQQNGDLPRDWKFDPNNLDSQLLASLAAMKDMRRRLNNPDDPFELGAYYNGGTNGLRAYQNGGAMAPETADYIQKQRRFMTDANLTPQQIERISAQTPGAQNGTGPQNLQGSSTSSSSTTRRSVFDQGALDSVNRALGAMQGPGGFFDNAITAVSDRGAAMSLVGSQLQTAIQQAGDDAAESARAQATLKAAGEARRAAILTQANLDPVVSGNRAQVALDQLDKTTAQLDAMRPEIQERMNVGFFDNPFAYLVNQVRLPGMISEYNGLVNVQQDQLNRYDAATAIAKSSIDISQGIDADLTLEAGNALAKAAASKAAMESKQVQLQLASKSAADALNMVQLGLQSSDLAMKAAQLTAVKEAQHEDESQRQYEARMQEKQLEDLNLMIKAAGGKPLDPFAFKRLPLKAIEDLKQNITSGKFGSDFTEALRFVQQWGNLDNMAEGGQAGVRTWVNQAQRDASAITLEQQTRAQAPATLDKTFNPQKAQANNLNAIASQYEAQAAVDMRQAKEGNPFKLSYKQIIQLPELKDNSVAKLIASHGPGGTEKVWDKVDELDLMKYFANQAAVSQNPGDLVKKYSADVAQFYQVAARKQAEYTKWALFGLSKPDKTYAVKLPGFSDKNLTVDLGDQSSVENMLTKKTAQNIRDANTMTFFGEGSWVDMSAGQMTPEQQQFVNGARR